MGVLIIVVIVLIVLLGGAILAYNGLIRRRNRTQEAWSEIDVELKRRHDLIPNLVETVKGYAAHEQQTFEAVTTARAGAISAGASGDPAQIAPAENLLTQTLRSLFAVAENYPQLRAVETFLQLQEQLTATEDKIEYARRYYNTSARDFNIALQSFPRNILAGMFGFHAVGFFEAPEADRAVPQVSFGTTPGAPGASGAPSGPPNADLSGPPPSDSSGPPSAESSGPPLA
jgi:LemA protein